MRQISVDDKTYETLRKVREAWTRPDGRRLTMAQTVEIMVRLMPGRLSWEDIDSVGQLRSPSHGRPKNCSRCENRGWLWARDLESGEMEKRACSCHRGEKFRAALDPTDEPG